MQQTEDKHDAFSIPTSLTKMKACCEKEGAWSPLEDRILVNYVQVRGEENWKDLSRKAGLKRCGESCKHRWLNYLKPAIQREHISLDEQELIVRLHKLLGNRWSIIAGRLPGRTEDEIKNYWNTYLSKEEIEEKQNNNKLIPIPSTNMSSVQSPYCSENSLGMESPPAVIKPKAVRLTKHRYSMKYTMNLSGWDSRQSPSASTSYDEHDM
ncbi:Anthocyanin regulatory C1 protein, partial [Mucuna pruriens]